MLNIKTDVTYILFLVLCWQFAFTVLQFSMSIATLNENSPYFSLKLFNFKYLTIVNTIIIFIKLSSMC